MKNTEHRQRDFFMGFEAGYEYGKKMGIRRFISVLSNDTVRDALEDYTDEDRMMAVDHFDSVAWPDYAAEIEEDEDE